MKQAIIKLLIFLYPPPWRQRYGDEYRTLLEEMPFTWGTGLDSVRGAVDAHLHPEWANFGRWPMNQKRSFRVAGNGALLSALLLILGFFSANRIPEGDAEFLLLLAPIALLPIVVALDF